MHMKLSRDCSLFHLAYWLPHNNNSMHTHTLKPILRKLRQYLKVRLPGQTWFFYSIIMSYFNPFNSATRGGKYFQREKLIGKRHASALKCFVFVQVLPVLPGSSSGSSITILSPFQRTSCPCLCVKKLGFSLIIATLKMMESVCLSIFYRVMKHVDFFWASLSLTSSGEP